MRAAAGEKLGLAASESDDGTLVMASFHAIAAGYAGRGYLSEGVQPVYREYEKYVAAMKTPAAEQYLELHIGHCTYVAPEEEQFVTPETISATTMIGRARKSSSGSERSSARIVQVFINPPMDRISTTVSTRSRAT